MTQYIMRRLFGSIPTLGLLIILTGFAVRLAPGNPVDIVLEESGARPAERARLEDQLGLNDNLPTYLASYLRDLGDGSFGHSIWSDATVTEKLKKAAPPTLQLTVMSMLIATCVGVPAGLASAVWRNRWQDYLIRSTVLLSMCLPAFVLATAVVILPAYYWGWTPPLQFVAVTDDPIANLKFFLVPSMILGASLGASTARFTRTAMLDVLASDYVRTARAKGLSERLVVWRHAVRNALVPVVTIMGNQVLGLLGGALVVETIFNIPGVGRLVLDSIGLRDYPMVQGLTLIIGCTVVVVNLIVDTSYVTLDPRIRLG